VIPLDVSLNEVVCEDEPVDTAGVHKLRVSSREDIVAEKLRSLLQQPVRNRYRRQDLLDIAVTRRQRPLDADKVADFLRRKSAARNIVVSRAAFRDPEVKRRAAQDYDGLASTTRTLFVAFDDAWSELLALLDALPIDP
jgi:predicted nucleotidyltransferase component of viral defense system